MHVLIIAPVHSGALYINAAQELGATVSIIVPKENNELDEVSQAKADTVVVADDLSLSALLEAATAIHASNPVTTVVAGLEFVVSQTAHIARALELPGLDPETVELVRNKAAMRTRLQEAGVRTVRFAKASTATDIEHAAEKVGFPAVIKPLDMAGSIGVVRVNDPIELLAAYEDILHETGWGGQTLGTDALLEELLVGTEYCVDGYVTQDGTVHVFELVKVELGPQPHFQEIGYTSYRKEDLDCAPELIDYITDVVRATNITVGPFHSEVMLTADGPILIEIASRLPGDHLPLLTERATGISFAKCSLAALMGAPIPQPATPAARVAASQFIIAPEVAGEVYRGLTQWDDIASDPAVDSAVYEVAPGTIVPAQQDFRSRLAEIQFHADTVAEAEAFRQKIVETLRVIR